jgi:hypothetical protein
MTDPIAKVQNKADSVAICTELGLNAKLRGVITMWEILSVLFFLWVVAQTIRGIVALVAWGSESLRRPQ